jgi:hypothetical protein
VTPKCWCNIAECRGETTDNGIGMRIGCTSVVLIALKNSGTPLVFYLMCSADLKWFESPYQDS